MIKFIVDWLVEKNGTGESSRRDFHIAVRIIIIGLIVLFFQIYNH